MENSKLLSRLLPVLVMAGLLAATSGPSAVAAPVRAVRTSRVVRRSGAQQFPTNAQAATDAAPSSDETRRPFSDISLSPRPSALEPLRSTLPVPKVPATAVDSTGRSAMAFEGLNVFQERYIAGNGNQFTWTPPDQGLCAGNGYVFETVNDALRVFTDQGSPASPPVSLNQFYGYPPQITRPDGPPFGPEPTDPSCYFDSQYRRWVVVDLNFQAFRRTGNLTLKNSIDLAVSSTANPLGRWSFYRIWATDDGTNGTPTNTDCPCIGDYPHIGADRYGIYVTTNEYPWRGSRSGIFHNDFNGAQVYVISKRDLLESAASVTVWQFSNLALSDGTPSFVLWPAEVPGTAYSDSHRGTEYFLQTAATAETNNEQRGMADTIGLWRMTNTRSLDGSADPRLNSTVLSSEIYGVPPASEQKVGPTPLRDCLLIKCAPQTGPSIGEVEGPLDSGDSRMQQTWLVDGNVYGSFSTIINVGGQYRSGIAWVRVQPGSDLATSTVKRQGYVGIDGNLHYPAIATTKSGQGVMAMSLSGANYYPSASYIRFATTGPAGSVQVTGQGAGPLDDLCEYVFYNCAFPAPGSRPRYGDYGAAVWDQGRIWIASEYVAQSCRIGKFETDPTCGGSRGFFSNWSTRISQITP